MKPFIILVIFLVALTITQADLVIEQKIEGGGQNGTVTTLSLKENKLRVDVPSRAGVVSSIIDMNTGDSMTLMLGQKLVTKRSGAMTKEAIDALRKKTNATTSGGNSKPEATGRKEKVGEFNTEVFTWKGGNGVQTIWVTQDIPNYSKVKEQFDRLSKSATAELQKGLAPDMSTLPGIVVKTELKTDNQNYTSTVLSVREEDLSSSLFEAPPDFRDPAKPAQNPDPRAETTLPTKPAPKN